MAYAEGLIAIDRLYDQRDGARDLCLSLAGQMSLWAEELEDGELRDIADLLGDYSDNL